MMPWLLTKKRVQVDPDSAHAPRSAWLGLPCEGDFQRAVVELTKAIEIDPSYARAYGHLGRAYYDLRDWEDAIPAFRKALELE